MTARSTDRPGSASIPVVPSRPWPVPEALGPSIEYPRGAVLFRQGDRPTTLFLIERGLVRLVHSACDGRETVVGWRGAQWLIGVANAIGNQEFSLEAETLTRCKVRQLDIGEFKRLRQSHSSAIDWIVESLAHEVHEHLDAIASIGSHRARTRLERLLVQILSIESVRLANGAVRLCAGLTYGDLASLINVSPQHFSRLLAEMEQDRCVNRHRGSLVFPKDGSVARSVAEATFNKA
jgi:CRP/FNR family transcriptional regulator